MKYSAAAVIIILFVTLSGCAPESEQTLTVNVAASMTDAVQEIVNAFNEETGVAVQLNIASSGTLARQIASGMPTDVFISANMEWMDYLANEHGLISGSRFKVAGNRLVVIIPVEAQKVPKTLEEIAAFSADGIAIGDPSHVPAGKYAKELLEEFGIWEEAEEHIIPARDVRAALAYVERGEVGIGIVYTSDALPSGRARVAFVIPKDLHTPIVYEAAIPHGANEANARFFIEFLRGPVGQTSFEKHGFTTLSEKQ